MRGVRLTNEFKIIRNTRAGCLDGNKQQRHGQPAVCVLRRSSSQAPSKEEATLMVYM